MNNSQFNCRNFLVNSVLAIVLGAGLASLILPDIVRAQGQPILSIEESLRMQVEMLKKSLPIQVDAATSWYDVNADGKKIIYDYRIKIDPSPESIKIMQGIAKKTVAAHMCSQQGIQEYLNLGASMQMNYSTESGKKLFDVDLRQGDC